MERLASLSAGLPRVCRLGLATRGNTRLSVNDIRWALDRGLNYLNWCGHDDGLSRAVSQLSAPERDRVVVAYQFSAASARAAERELSQALKSLGTDRIDVLTFYYVESPSEWQEITGPGGALEYLKVARKEGKVRLFGLTTHQRKLAAEWAQSGLLDLLMVRYNAAHRGAETEVFPVTRKNGIPVVAFTCLRWKALLKSTSADPEGWTAPAAREWYRFVLANPDVSVALMAPHGRAELEDNLALLENWRSPEPELLQALREHGERVREHAGTFL
ncbi:MAG: aldo/keto reductase [Acidobacteriota bacterium]